MRRQFWPIFWRLAIFDPFPPPNCRRRLWTAPCVDLLYYHAECFRYLVYSIKMLTCSFIWDLLQYVPTIWYGINSTRAPIFWNNSILSLQFQICSYVQRRSKYYSLNLLVGARLCLCLSLLESQCSATEIQTIFKLFNQSKSVLNCCKHL